MKNASRILFVFGITLMLGFFFSENNFAQQQKGSKAGIGFVDLNGDGINDNAYDSDGDGIINCQDPDFVKPLDGTGRKLMKGNANKFGKGGYGPGDGTGNNAIGPKDGTGYGAGTSAGVCDGTGSKGQAKRMGRK